MAPVSQHLAEYGDVRVPGMRSPRGEAPEDGGLDSGRGDQPDHDGPHAEAGDRQSERDPELCDSGGQLAERTCAEVHLAVKQGAGADAHSADDE